MQAFDPGITCSDFTHTRPHMFRALTYEERDPDTGNHGELTLK